MSEPNVHETDRLCLTLTWRQTVASSGWPASRIFFLVYYFLTVVIIFNLVIAYVLERYDEQVEFSLAK